jgi:hypothetical protein
VDEFVEIVRVAVALEPGTRLTDDGVMLVERPGTDCDGAAEMLIVPVKPMLSSVMVESVEPPAMKLD